MPHPAYNEKATAPYPFTYMQGNAPYVSTGGGSSSGSAAFLYSAHARPASTKNAKLPSGWRNMAPWQASGGRYQANFGDRWCLRNSGASPPFFSRIGASVDWGQASFGSFVIGNIPVVSSSLQADVDAKVLKTFTDREVQFNTTLRDAGKTLHMVGDAARSMAHGLEDVMRRQKGPNRRMSNWKKLPSAYLEYLYGWRPLSEDIANAFEQLNFDMRTQGKRFLVTLKKSQTRSMTQTIRDGQAGWNPVSPSFGYFDADFEVKQRNSTVLRFIFPEWQATELPTVSPFGNLWEQTPYSFVIDWFLPIGNWVASMEALQYSMNFASGTRAQLLTRKAAGCWYRPNPSGGFTIIERPSLSVSGSDYSYSRSLVSSLYDIVHFPNLRKPLSLDHAAQGLALLTQVTKKWT